MSSAIANYFCSHDGAPCVRSCALSGMGCARLNHEIQVFADEVSVVLSPEQARLARLIDEARAGQASLREQAARETAEGVARRCFDQPLLKALGVPEFDFEDEAQALRSKALEEMRASAACRHDVPYRYACGECDGSA